MAFCRVALSTGILLLALTQAQAQGALSPAFFLSTSSSFSAGAAVDYASHAFSDLSSLLASKLSKAVSDGSPAPDLVLVAFSSETIPRLNAADAPLLDLKESLDAAPSSTVFTSVFHACSDNTQHHFSHLLSSVAGVPPAVVLSDSCPLSELALLPSYSVTSDPTAYLKSLGLRRGGGGQAPTVLSVCLSGSSEEAASAEFVRLWKGLTNATHNAAALFLPNTPLSDCQPRRSLAEAPGPAPLEKCDATCQARARILEFTMVAIVLLIALVSGLCCLADLDTPTKIEVPRETS